MTPATRALDDLGIDYAVRQFERADVLHGFGEEAASALGVPGDEVFKTLVIELDDALAVAILPVTCQLSMKLAATALGAKRAQLCDRDRAERSSGYVFGGISPFGQKRRLPTVIDESALRHDRIFVSGGRRGLDIAVAPADLIRALDAVVAPIAA
jgi:Cys-tRNA(Pro)/Cys-tRNA(Cys) deacylase